MKFKPFLVAILVVVIALASVAFYFSVKHPTENRENEPQFLYSITGDAVYKLKEPTYAVADGKGKVYISDSGNRRVMIFNDKGKFLLEIGGPQSKKPLSYPYGIGLLDKNRVIVADTGSGALHEYNGQGDYIKTWLEPDDASMATAKALPAGVFVGPDRLVYVTDLASKQILVFSFEGTLLKKISSNKVAMGTPLGIAVNKEGAIWVADGGNYNIKLLGKDGQVRTVFDGGPEKALSMAKGLAMDKQDRIYVADTMSNIIRVFDIQGNDLFSIGKEQEAKLSLPNGLYIDSTNRIYIADQGNNRIQVWGWKQ